LRRKRQVSTKTLESRPGLYLTQKDGAHVRRKACKFTVKQIRKSGGAKSTSHAARRSSKSSGLNWAKKKNKGSTSHYKRKIVNINLGGGNFGLRGG